MRTMQAPERHSKFKNGLKAVMLWLSTLTKKIYSSASISRRGSSALATTRIKGCIITMTMIITISTSSVIQVIDVIQRNQVILTLRLLKILEIFVGPEADLVALARQGTKTPCPIPFPSSRPTSQHPRSWLTIHSTSTVSKSNTLYPFQKRTYTCLSCL